MPSPHTHTPNRPTWTPPPHPKSPHPPKPLLDPPHLPLLDPPPQGASGQKLVGGVVGVQNRGVAPPGDRRLSQPTGYRAVDLPKATQSPRPVSGQCIIFHSRTRIIRRGWLGSNTRNSARMCIFQVV